MSNAHEDHTILRPLAERYSELAGLEIQAERLERYRKTISLEEVRPVVLIDEVPWGEIDDDDLKLRCRGSEARDIETRLRRALYQWLHFQVDRVIPPVFRVAKKINYGGIGLEVQEIQIQAATGTYAASHEYTDQLQNEDDLARLTLPEVSYARRPTERMAEVAESVFAGLMPVELVGTNLGYNIWDRIAEYRGVEKLLMDLAMRPDFMHQIARRFMEIGESIFDQLLALDLLDTKPIILHCTPASSGELPAADFDGSVRKRDLWGRCAAQIFAAVSPEMHDEFDLAYNQQLFGDCGLLYYGCCEPMDSKIDILRKRFKNLRKISITPWADPESAARQMGSDFVLAAKPNPAFVSSPEFNAEQVRQEITGYLESCRRHGTTCEFVLKDVSTISGNPENLSQWALTVESVINSYY